MRQNFTFLRSMISCFSSVKPKLFLSLFGFAILFLQPALAQNLHTTSNCPPGQIAGNVVWGNGSDEFDWTDGALTFTANNVSGTQVDVTFTWTGETSSLAVFNGVQTPNIESSLTGGTDAITLVTNGFTGTGMTLTMTLSPPIPGSIGYEIYHMNTTGVGGAGDQYTISATTTEGTTIFPTFTANGTPSWSNTGPGVVNATAASTTGQNDQVGVNFNTNEYISTITMVWNDCSTCGTNQFHGAAIGSFDFCIDDWDADGVHNLVDRDDDNDGILDSDEQCSSSSAGGTIDWDSENWSSGSGSGSFTVAGVTATVSYSSDGNALSAINDQTTHTGGLSGESSLYVEVNQGSNESTVTGSWDFSDPVDSLSFTVFDIDLSGTSFIDSFRVVGYSFGEQIYPTLTAGSANSVNENSALGTSSSGSSSSNGNVAVQFAFPIDSMVLYFTNGQAADANPGSQAYSLHDLTWTRSCTSYDYDGDGTPNHLDIDSENDGVLDLYESGIAQTSISALDADGDGVMDPSVAVGTNGVVDAIETVADNEILNYTYLDTDLDGILNRLDIDSDNDGITDLTESGAGTDSDGDGIIDGSADADEDGMLDSGDSDDGAIGSPGTTPTNSDSDDFPNFIDIDADDDGIIDNIEAQATTGTPIVPGGSDSDSDGLDDNFESTNGLDPVDTDSDGIDDYQDTDSDADGDIDSLEGYDTDNDGTANTTASGSDTDGDGLDNNFDNVNGWNSTTNVTNSGQDALDFPNLDVVGTSERDWREAQDCDGDGFPDLSDADSDNDGIPNTIEGTGDTDGDGIADICDLDSDGDGIYDIIEAGGTDADNDGMVDSFTDVGSAGGYTISTGCSTTPETISSPTNPTQTDDGNIDITEPFSFDFFGVTQSGDLRLNMNGWLSFDQPSTFVPYNAVSYPNATYTNTIAFNHLDISPNNGGTVNYGTNGTSPNRIFLVDFDSTPFFNGGGTATMQLQLHETTNEIRIVTTNLSPSFSENTTMGLNQDGTTAITVSGRNAASYTITTAECQSFIYSSGTSVNGYDDGLEASPLPVPDSDGDGVADYLDIDADDDGIVDLIEAQPTSSITYPSGSDSDNDGIDDNFEGGSLDPEDTDGDGVDDYRDTDSDNDGDSDLLEGYDTDNDGTANTIPAGTDTDGDGLDDNFDNVSGPNATTNISNNNQDALDFPNLDDSGTSERDWREAKDLDGDGITDVNDLDVDGDGIPNTEEGCETATAAFNTTLDWDTDSWNGSTTTFNLSGLDVTATFSSDGGTSTVGDNTIHSGGNSPTPTTIHNDLNFVTGAQTATYTWDLSANVDTLTFDLYDIDADVVGSFQHIDEITITGYLDGATVLPTLTGSTANSISTNTATGVSDADDATNEGTVNVAFYNTIDSVVFVFGNSSSLVVGNPSSNGWSITDMYFGAGPDNNCTGDTDGDGVLDYVDLDADNDGVLDLYESGLSDALLAVIDPDGDGVINSGVNTSGTNGLSDTLETVADNGTLNYTVLDTDGDGVNNFNDLDSDNDGLPDLTENGNGTDANTDGIIDGTTDTDGDGVLDSGDSDDAAFGSPSTTPLDTDQDGVNNSIDIDSDNDGITDLTESGGTGTDADTDGVVDGSADADGDGILDSADSDDGNDGSPGTSPTNTDGGSFPDYLDIDADDDGIIDNIEAQASTGSPIVPGGTDSDGDGLDNNFESTDGLDPVDTESDGTPDYIDTDSDNDGDSDALEGYDTDNDGTANTVASGSDTDGDGLDNNYDNVNGWNNTTNVTNNGQTSNSFPDLDNTASAERDWREHPDTDGDGIADNIDIDDDNDGVPDTNESGSNEPDGDEDGDGIPNWKDDTDGGSGGDGSTTDYTDSNGDGIPDVYDNDGDGVPNHLDLDADNDGILDLAESGLPDATLTSIDADSNGVIDGSVAVGTNGLANTLETSADNGVLNYTVADTDGDGVDDSQDLDSDNDGITDLAESGTGTDSDNDGIIDGSADADGDGVLDSGDSDDAAFGSPSTFPTNTDGTGPANYRDLDSDDDGITDLAENGNGTDANNDGIVDGASDADGDGILDSADSDDANDGSPNTDPLDTDQDGVDNYVDIDSDNDGITDLTESGTGTDADTDGVVDGTADADDDGILDSADSDDATDGSPGSTPTNSDADSFADFIDIDADDDGIIDNIEAQASTGSPIVPGGSDSDGDGLDNNFEGTDGLDPVDTDSDGTPDYLDSDSDNDGDSDALEGYDTDNDGTANTTAAGSDTDGDGLDNNYDNVNGWNSTTNVTNSGQTSNSFPDLDNTVSAERDWREHPDTDGDGIADNIDIDDDNDGVPDTNESGGNEPDGDEDGDSIPNWKDTSDGGSGGDGSTTDYTDSNGDGIPDVYDNDGDGVPNHLDLDADNDGILDLAESGLTDATLTTIDSDSNGVIDGSVAVGTNGLANTLETSADNGVLNYTEADTDGDGENDSQDLDSDNDGITDLAESGAGTDSDNDGIIDGTADADGDGVLDSGDSDDAAFGSPSTFPTNTDGTGPANYRDLDSDDDGITDLAENGNGTDANNDGIVDGTADADADGILDSADSDDANDGSPNTDPLDTDQDGVDNYVDIDSDNDGITDLTESGTGTDADTDGVVDGTADADGDGILDSADSDDGTDGSPGSTPTNSDADSFANFIDIDSDDDGIIDNIEAQASTGSPIVPSGSDSDGDGLDDNFESTDGLDPVDTESDGTVDYLDSDSDDDNDSDALEGYDTDNDGTANTTAAGSDADGDGLDDNFDNVNGWNSTTNVTNSGQTSNSFPNLDNSGTTERDWREKPDTDNDGIPNETDLDDDNDGIPDIDESSSFEPDGDEDGDGIENYRDNSDGGNSGDGSSTSYVDSDGDGIPNVYDTDGDGVPNHLDLDSDNDGILDIAESGLTDTELASLDADNDGVIDGSVAVGTNGLANDVETVADNGVLDYTIANTDGNGPNDQFDLDSDDDGITDHAESGTGTDSDNDGIVDGSADTDGDGILDSEDSDDAAFGSPSTFPTNTDGTDIGNWRDLDSDNDGIPDLLENGNGVDNDDNGILDGSADADGDGILDSADSDDANDGSPSTSPTDTEGDGVPNFRDIDSDNDGIPDLTESGSGTDANNDGVVDGSSDSDGDGIITSADNNDALDGSPSYVPTDTDSDNFPNYLDIDSDDDGIIDNIEGQATTGTPVQPGGSDSDGDGLDDNFESTNGLDPVDTESDGTEDYLDSDSDDDGESDLIEGNDGDNDGAADTSPSGSDTDGDGLDNSYDNVNGWNSTTNVTNNGQDALDFPDHDEGETERDWREEPCANGSVVLAPSGTTTSAPSKCNQSPWTYYYNALNPSDLLFAIEKFPSGGGANTSAFTAEVSITVNSNPTLSSGVYSNTSLGLPIEGTFVMSRYWNVNVTSGSINGTVNVRFFYDPAELTQLETTAQAFNASNGGGSLVESGVMWFKTTNGITFDDGVQITTAGISNSLGLTPAATGTIDGVTYVQFDGVAGFSGGTAAFTVGQNSVVLPIELLSFDAIKREDKVQLLWSTATEINNDFFTIERSTDLENWEVVDIVNGAGNSSTVLNYETWDENPLPGRSYYRLKQTDFDGSFEYSEARLVTFNDPGLGLAIRVIPNPSSGDVNISINSGKSSQVGVHLLDATGKVIRQMTLNSETGSHDVYYYGLASGTYMVRVITENGVAVEKLVVH